MRFWRVWTGLLLVWEELGFGLLDWGWLLSARIEVIEVSSSSSWESGVARLLGFVGFILAVS